MMGYLNMKIEELMEERLRKDIQRNGERLMKEGETPRALIRAAPTNRSSGQHCACMLVLPLSS
jgi:hypothetical protein